jgi:hypothetical protein
MQTTPAITCPWTGKRGWRTHAVAAYKAKRVSEVENLQLRPYVCPACLHFHLTRRVHAYAPVAPPDIVLT